MPQLLTNQQLLEKLDQSPDVRERLEAILLSISDEQGELKDADSAEMHLIEEMRRMGHTSLSAWAQRKAEHETELRHDEQNVRRDGKKNSAGILHLGM
jgi:hypothetical protein